MFFSEGWVFYKSGLPVKNFPQSDLEARLAHVMYIKRKPIENWVTEVRASSPATRKEPKSTSPSFAACRQPLTWVTQQHPRGDLTP